MKKFILSLVISLLLCTCVFASEPVVYVSGFGNDANCGSREEPLKTIEAGFHSLPNGGTLVVTTAYSFQKTLEFPEVDGLVTVTSFDGTTDYRELYNAKILIGEHIKLRGNVKFENIEITSFAKNCAIFCNGHYTCFGEGVRTSTTSDEINLIGITCAGSGRHPSKGTFVEIHSGDYSRIRGGQNNTIAELNGDVNIAMYGGTVHEYLRLAGDTFTNGDGNLYIFGGTFKKGIRLANSTGFSGSINVSVFGGTFEGEISISNGGNVGENVNINLFANTKKAISMPKGSVNGKIRINTANASFAISNFDTYVISDVVAAKEAAINTLLKAKEEKLATSWSTALNERDMKYTTSVTMFDKYTPDGDLDKNGFLSVRDALLALRGTDIDGDGRNTVQDAATLINATLNNATNTSEIQRGCGKTKLYGAAFAGEHLTRGYAFADIKTQNYTLFSDVVFSEKGIVGLFFGCDNDDPKITNGYYFEVSKERGKLAAYKVTNGLYRYIAEKELDILSNEARIKVEYSDGAAKLYFDDNVLEVSQFFDFNFSLEPLGTTVGMYVENATATLMRYENFEFNASETYKNNMINQFTDPDIFCENGIYYIYGSGSGTGEGKTGGINCYSTTDFVNFKYEGQVLKKGDTFGESGFLCANIVKYDGYYYMFYSAYSEEFGRSPTAYASSTSPTGPFTNPDMKPLTNIPDMLGGQPFVDDDGTAYLIYTRTQGGNQTYGAKVILDNGKATLDVSSEKFLLGVTEPWEAARASVVECGLIVKHGGLYYLLFAGGNYNSTYGVGYAVSTSPLGPYTKYKHNPVFIGTAQSFGVGAASVFPSSDGSEYFIIYLRNFSYYQTNPLQTCMDRFRFVRDPRGGADIIEICGPSVTPQPIPSAHHNMSADEWQAIRFHP
ncbi:MAG: hypothetical protein E7598_02270 [Ruminococcaceae bacterium]|nr:hypothetical protein [Oscillospiraceae bacterium]